MHRYRNITKPHRRQQSLQFDAIETMASPDFNRQPAAEITTLKDMQVHLAALMEKARIMDSQLALILVNLDRFRSINRHLGHSVGDLLLSEVNKRLLQYAPSSAAVGRFGTDNYYIALSDAESFPWLHQFAQGIVPLLSEPFMINGIELGIAASIGISLYPNDGLQADDLLNMAEIALQQAKEKGGGIVQMYHPEIGRRLEDEFSIEMELRKALARKEFSVHYQPLVNVQTGRIIGVEALLRWMHPVKGNIPPDSFIPIAEKTGLITPIGEWVLREACSRCADWEQQGYGPLMVSVNVSVAQFMIPNFLTVLEKTLQDTSLDPSRLQLEITESIALNNSSYISETMSRIQRLGVKLAVDDFGTGYSSLYCLKRYPVHTLKIDRSLTFDAHENEESAAIVTALIAMARQLGIVSLAEGVESPMQHEFFKLQGCEEAQGYLYGRPVPLEALEAALAAGSVTIP